MDEAQKKKQASNFMKPCKACGHMVHVRAKNCGFCHCVDPIERDPAPPAAAAAPPTASVVPLRQEPRIVPSTVFVVARAYKTQINGATVSYEKGRIIDNFDLARILIASGAPVEEIARGDLIECPYCAKMFGKPREDEKAKKA